MTSPRNAKRTWSSWLQFSLPEPLIFVICVGFLVAPAFHVADHCVQLRLKYEYLQDAAAKPRPFRPDTSFPNPIRDQQIEQYDRDIAALKEIEESSWFYIWLGSWLA